MGRFIDISGQKYGRLLVIRPVDGSGGSGKSYVFECLCDCGEIVSVSSNSLRKGNTKSCGCLSREKSAKTLSAWRRANPLSGNARKYDVNHSYFDTIDSEDKAYWLGFITADGCVNEKGSSLTVSVVLKGSDYEHLQKFADCLESDYPVYRYEKCSLVIASLRLGQALISLGVTPRKSFTVETCKEVPYELQRHYWRGLVDGDGCLHIRKDGYFEISLVGTRSICEGFMNWIRSIGIYSRARVNPVRTFFQIRYNGDELVKKICRELYGDSNIYLQRKYEICQEITSI
jgi:acylphosphatase